MRAFVLALISLLSTIHLCAEPVCSRASTQRDAATVSQIRSTLRSIKLDKDDPDDKLPSIAQRNVPALKSALAQTARDVLACTPITVAPAVLQAELARLLDANPPQPPPNTAVMNGDKRYAEWLAFEYGGNLLVNVRNLNPKLVAVTFTFHIPCGDDNMLVIFESDESRWHERLLWQAPPYKEISGAFGDIYENAILQEGPQSPWRLVAVHGTPWCMSRFSGFAIDILEPAAARPQPRVVWHTERGYSRGDFEPKLKASGNTFELRINDDAMQFDIGRAYERHVIFRYRVTGDRVERIEPIATNARGFVEE
jgi:hypothetical protein